MTGRSSSAATRPTVALGHRTTELIEVELTPKRAPPYAAIFTAYRNRLDRGDTDRIAYLCNHDSARAVRAALSASDPARAIAERVAVREVFDARGAVTGAMPTPRLCACSRRCLPPLASSTGPARTRSCCRPDDRCRSRH
jgi:hypothetical protein